MRDRAFRSVSTEFAMQEIIRYRYTVLFVHVCLFAMIQKLHVSSSRREIF